MYVQDLLLLFLLVSAVRHCSCWDREELDLFDLVEDIGQNFYEVLQVEESASGSEIRRAYRHLSLIHHPDKNSDPEATEKFRKLVAVAEVLRDDQKRAWYDRILQEGLPDWRHAVYYYRRVRKMGMVELLLLLFAIASVAHYLFGWAVYIEKQLELQDVLDRKERKEKRSKQGKPKSQRLEAEVEYRTAQANASIPQLKNLLPFILARWLVTLTKLGLRLYHEWREERKTHHESEITKTGMPVCNGTAHKNSTSPHANHKRKRLQDGGDTTRDRTDTSRFAEEGLVMECTSCPSRHSDDDPLTESTSSSGGTQNHGCRTSTPSEQQDTRHFENDSGQANVCSLDTSTEDCGTGNRTSGSLVSSTRASKGGQRNATVLGERRMNKGRYGTVESKMAVVNVATGDIVTLDEDDAGSGATPFPPSVSSPSETAAPSHPTTGISTSSPPPVSFPPPVSSPPTASSPPPVSSPPTAGWTQYQQRQLEWALGQYPKFTKDRWDNVSKAVPGKSTGECIERCKELFEAVKRRKHTS